MKPRADVVQRLVTGMHVGLIAVARDDESISVAEMFSASCTITGAFLQTIVEKTLPDEWLHNKTELLRVIEGFREQVEPSHIN